jgi:hypothetical protein
VFSTVKVVRHKRRIWLWKKLCCATQGSR